MMSNAQKPEHLITSGTQTVGGCPDTIFLLRTTQMKGGVTSPEKTNQHDSAIQRKFYVSDQELMDQAYADYWTL